MNILGIDVGGSGIKGAIVDTKKGILISERHRIATPQPPNPKNISNTIAEMVKHFKYKGPVGCGFPTVVVKGKSLTEGNIDPKWTGVQIDKVFEKATGLKFTVMNDADIAGFAELKFGAAKSKKGLIVMLTVGTGIGSGLFQDDVLIPNIEMGRLLGKNGKPIEFWAGDKARKDQNLEWEEWGKRFNFFLKHIVRTFSPDYFILGGGISKKYDNYKKYIKVSTPLLIAKFMNNAGIIGAAIAAEQNHKN